MLPCALIVAAFGGSLSAFEPTTVDTVQFNITIRELPAALAPKVGHADRHRDPRGLRDSTEEVSGLSLSGIRPTRRSSRL